MFQIAHPVDPTNKYLSHSFVESPDMMNVYNGNVTLDGDGTAWVRLPDWFEALNRDFRYQLTAIGAPGPNLYIASKVAGNRFNIAGEATDGEVSWQVTGIRQDAWANAHRIAVEQEKPSTERARTCIRRSMSSRSRPCLLESPSVQRPRIGASGPGGGSTRGSQSLSWWQEGCRDAATPRLEVSS